jgi:hypothetical protein
MKRWRHILAGISPTTDESLVNWIKDAVDLKTALDEHAIVVITGPEGT